MIALKIEDMKQFTARLFMGETFDHFLIREAEIITFNVFTIDGHIRQGYYSEEELEEQKKKTLREKQQAAQDAKAAKAAKAATSTTEAGRVGDRPYARGRAYKADRYDET